ncbi:hypothetical protein P3S67_016208 [Capsicum chacoense]
MELFIAHKKIAQLCTINFNGDFGYEITEGKDRHIVNLVEKKCTYRSWQLTEIPCPHAIKAMEHNKMKPDLMKKEISMWYSKETYLKTYKAKLLPTRGENFWNILPEHAMDPPDFVKTIGRPRTKRTREKDTTIKRAGEWAHSRKGARMICSKCGSVTHNARTCKFDKEEQRAGLKRKRGRTEEEEEEKFQEKVQEDVYAVNCSGPPPTQEEDDYLMSTPGLPEQQYEPFGPARESESDPALRLQTVPEDITRLLARQTSRMSYSSWSKLIDFRGDLFGVSEPTDLPYSSTKLTWKGKRVVTSNQLENAREKNLGKLKAIKANGKSQV